MDPRLIVQKKRDGHDLADEEIAMFVDAYTRGKIPDYQMAALAMAVFFRGMGPRETVALTRAIITSGKTLAWKEGIGPIVDKHSTGGIGDKVSLVLAPLLATHGLAVPMVSGRGLGPTGGTVDKLEAIPGFRTDLSIEEIQTITARVGCAITGATDEICPADRKLYALRDVTATVASRPLITSSILAKKIAEGLDALVLDVTWGSGTFMKTVDDARELAQSMVDVGRQLGLRTSALITDMNQPRGRAVGNAVEVIEAVETLGGKGPDDLIEIVLALGAELLVQTGSSRAPAGARDELEKLLRNGQALETFRSMVSAQGGDPDARLAVAPASEIPATREGFVTAIDGEKIGHAVIELGGGRKQIGDTIDHAVGVEMLCRPGDHVKRDQPTVRIFATSRGADEARCLIRDAISIGDAPGVPAPPVVETVSNGRGP